MPNPENFLVWIVLFPLFGAVLNGLFGRSATKDLVSGVAVGSVLVSFLLSLAVFGKLVTLEGTTALSADIYEWFSISIGGHDVPIHVRFVADHLSGIMIVMVSGIATLIHFYSIGYMGDDPGYPRFMTYLNLFTASMLVLVLASNVPLMFVGWEGVGLCSYLLIGFWFDNANYAAAGRKAFVVNRIGDFGVLVGTFILVGYVTTKLGADDGFEFSVINDHAARMGAGSTFSFFSADGAPADGGFMVATIGMLFIFLGCTGKSAQIPLFTWLPDAMAGPTPVSALIHAATMVTAGVYLCCRLSPVLVQSQVAMSVIAIVGALTALLAASIALVQNEMKKILAYSTVSQLGFMFAAVGSGAFAGGFFHVFTHAFFKACLFLGAGSVMHAVHAHGDADIRYLGGLRKKLPITHITFAIATVAIAGLPPLAGFFSKDEILLGAATFGATAPSGQEALVALLPEGQSLTADQWFAGTFGEGLWVGPWVGWFVFAVLAIAAAMTAFYMFRLYFKTFWGEYKGGHAHAHGEDHEHEHAHVEPHESPESMTYPLIALAAGACVVGFLGMPHQLGLPNLWSSWLTPQHETFLHALHEAEAQGVPEEALVDTAMAQAETVEGAVSSLQFGGQLVHAPGWVGWMAMGVGLLVAFLGFGLAFVFYFQQDGQVPRAIRQNAPALHRFLMDKWRVDELYRATVVVPMEWLAVFAANVDRIVIDGGLTKVTSAAVKGSGWVVTRAQNGVVFAYAGMFVVGFAGLAWWFTYPHATLRSEPRVGAVQWTAAHGLGYEYRWDYDSDGEWDVDWSDEASLLHEYSTERVAGFAAVFESPREQFGRSEVYFGPNSWLYEVSEAEMGPSWAIDPETNDQPPTLRYAQVQAFSGNLGAAPEPDPATQRRTATVTVAMYGAQEGGEPLFGPVERQVEVSAEGGFGLLLGLEAPIREERFPVWGANAEEQRRNEEAAEEQGLRVRRVAYVQVDQQPRTQIDLDPQAGLLLSINGSAVRDDEIVDGQRLLVPGSPPLSLGAAVLTVGARVRGTVEVRNMFGNTARDSRDATLLIESREARAVLEPTGAREGAVR